MASAVRGRPLYTTRALLYAGYTGAEKVMDKPCFFLSKGTAVTAVWQGLLVCGKVPLCQGVSVLILQKKKHISRRIT